jgi:hypothetical protein
MRKKGTLATGLLILLLISFAFEAVSLHSAADEAEWRLALPKENPAPTVAVRAASGATLGFRTQNGQTMDDVPPLALDLPHLVLYRNGALTHPDERTLILTVSDLVPPPSGVTVTLTLQTYHGDPDLGGALQDRITVWRASQWLDGSPDRDGTGGTVAFEHEFGATIMSGTQRVATPTDYFRIDLTIADENFSTSGPVYTYSEDYAFLMESQWIAPLKHEQPAPGSATPEELIVYYCDMFVFQQDLDDPTSRLGREEVPPYVENELVPAMLDAFRVQTVDWGFSWQEAWTSYRAEDGNRRLSVALSDGETWFHGEGPMRGHSGISLTAKGGANRNYGTLTDGLLSTFHHELFHNLQKGMAQEFGGHGDVDGEEDAGGFFSEGTAVLVESVAQAATEFARASGPRTYISHANGFIGRTAYHGELNSSYGKMTPYRAAIYWRFLYEQCGGMENGTEDPGAGMRVVRETLEVLYSEAVVDTRSSTDLVRSLPAIMDRVLSGTEEPLCPFRTFRESIQQFAHAIYQLRLDGGRCTAPGIPAGCGFYDPNNLYFNPPVSTLTYRGERIVFGAEDQPYARGIRSSFGIDFVDVELDPSTQGQSLTVELSGDPGGVAEFGLEIWELMDSGIPGEGEMGQLQVVNAAQLANRVIDRHLRFAISEIDTGKINRLGLIISRLDSEEDSDPVGAYTIVLQPSHGP